MVSILSAFGLGLVLSHLVTLPYAKSALNHYVNATTSNSQGDL